MSETFQCVRWYDPEIARHVDGESAGQYCVNRDMDALRALLPAEAVPLIFHCKRLTRSQRRTVQAQGSDERRYEVAFRYGVLSIQNMPAPSGPRTVELSRTKPDEALDDKAIDATGLSDPDLWEIGSVVYAHSFLPLGTPPSCPQLPSSLRAWAAVRIQSAGQSQDSQTDTDD